MVQYGDSGWVVKAALRKAVRDTERDRFVAEAGTTPSHALDEIAFAPQVQRRKVVSLMKVTRDAGLDQEQLKTLTTMAKALMQCGLGLGAMGSVAEAVLSPHQTHSTDLLDFFTPDYGQRDRD
ncbi:hypothetical protein [Tritonibacter scottomollicae]|uniref:Uncharacterized protein n=1 Tax=Tritonibacter scottomollicae TaxID=483013 RepID=A0A2T1A0F8_TRISK|nr:hypothetical protein [Tritonibacter scottomollicae]PRZ42089.1 hypothetical protein CLV89_1382 [Tritonibacter scottomollicae]